VAANDLAGTTVVEFKLLPDVLYEIPEAVVAGERLEAQELEIVLTNPCG
jgi:hypothetical protein